MRAEFNGLPEIVMLEAALRNVFLTHLPSSKCAGPESGERQRAGLAVYSFSQRLVRRLLTAADEFYLARNVRRASVPVIYMTGMTTVAALETGCLAYLTKPFSAKLLIEPLEERIVGLFGSKTQIIGAQ